MNQKWLSFYLEIGFMIILVIEASGASVTSSHQNSVPVNDSKIDEKSDDLQQRSDEITSLDEHLKMNKNLHNHFDSNEKLLNKQLTLNLRMPEINFNKELKSELFSDKEYRFNTGGLSNQEKEHPSILPFSHLISPHLKDDDFDVDRPVLGPELAQKYQRELHETLRAHHQNLHQALQNKHNNLRHDLHKHHIQNAQNLNLNKHGEHSSLYSGANEQTLYQNEHNSYNHENSKHQNENAYLSPSPNPNPSSGEGVHEYQYGHSPTKNNDYERPNHNNGQTHGTAYTKVEEPHHPVKSNTYASKEYYYENQKVHNSAPHSNHHTGYVLGGKEGNAGNSNLNPEYHSNAYQGDKGKSHNDRPHQYNSNPNLHVNKNQYEAVPQNYHNSNNQYEHVNHATNAASYNKNYQSENNYAAPNGPINNNKNNAPEYIPSHYQEHNSQNPHSYSGNVEDGNSKYGKPSSMSSQDYGPGGNNPPYNDRPHPNYNQNNDIKSNSPQVYSSNNGYNKNVNKNYDSNSFDPNSGHVNDYNQNSHGNAQGLTKDYNPMQHKQAYSGVQKYNNKINNNAMYYNGKTHNGYNREMPVDDRKKYNAPMHQSTSHSDREHYNSNLPQQPNMNSHNGKYSHNSAPFIQSNKSPYGTASQSYSNSKSNNQIAARPYNAVNQNAGHQNYPNNFYTNNSSPNPHRSQYNSGANTSIRGGSQNNSYLSRKENPMKAHAFSQNAKTSKVINAPVVHQIFMSEPLIKPDIFLSGMI